MMKPKFPNRIKRGGGIMNHLVAHAVEHQTTGPFETWTHADGCRRESAYRCAKPRCNCNTKQNEGSASRSLTLEEAAKENPHNVCSRLKTTTRVFSPSDGERARGEGLFSGF